MLLADSLVLNVTSFVSSRNFYTVCRHNPRHGTASCALYTLALIYWRVQLLSYMEAGGSDVRYEGLGGHIPHVSTFSARERMTATAS